MENFTLVSLGFAEYVSQLLHETFEATLGARDYQFERYLEIEEALAMPIHQFRERYISDEDLESFETELFGGPVSKNLDATEALEELVMQLAPELSGSQIIYRKKLTYRAMEILSKHALEKLHARKRINLSAILNKFQESAMIVDSGEIKTKLQLRSLARTNSQLQQQPITQLPKSEQVRESETVEDTSDEDSPTIEPIPSRVVEYGGVQVSELIDPKTKGKILLVDHRSLSNQLNVRRTLPNVRIIATPLSGSTSAMLDSEITIRFRTTS